MRALEVRPFPFERIARITRADVALLRSALRRAPPDLDRLTETLGTRIDSPVRVASSTIDVHTTESLGRRLAARVLALVFERTEGGRVALDLDAPIASVIAERILGGDGDPAACPTPEHLGPIERGLVAASICEALAAAGGPAAGWRLFGILDTALGIVEALQPSARIVTIALDVRIGGHRGQARLLLPEATSLRPPPHPSWPRGAFARIAALPIRLVGIAGRARLSTRELSSLRASDVLVLDRATVRRVSGTSEVDGFVGLRVHGGATSILWTKVQSRALVRAHEEDDDVPTSSDEITTDDAARELLGDQPVEVSVEIARTVLRADEVMALRAGEVVRTGAPVSAEVRLFAAGRLVARGELVDVEGEVGVRLLQTY